MRCQSCDYPLWNIPARACPECGASFSPSDYEFTPNSVHFCCPHCDGVYYGTDARGHLEPRSFVCEDCGSAVQLDRMVVRPIPGVDEVQTQPLKAPWLERKQRGRWNAFLATTGLALIQPNRLMRGVDPRSSQTAAWIYAALVHGAAMLLAFVPLGVLYGVLPFAMAGLGQRGGAMVGPLLLVLFVQIIVAWMFTLIYLVLWVLTAHAVIAFTAPRAGSLGRTIQAICYSSGANIATGVPFIGLFFGWIWWVVSAIFTFREAHRTDYVRATIAILVFPVVSTILLVVLYGMWVVYVMTATTGPFATRTVRVNSHETRTVVRGLLDHAAEHRGMWPRHAAELLRKPVELGPGTFVASGWLTTQADVPLADGRLIDVIGVGPNRRDAMIDDAIAAQPPGVIAHRFGDFVFTYHGIDSETGDPRLWVVVLSPDPEVNEGSAIANVHVGHLEGDVESIDIASFPSRLAEQNALRATAGLPPLADPLGMPREPLAPTPGERDEKARPGARAPP